MSLSAEEYFEKDRFFDFKEESYGSNNACSTCNYVFTGVLEKNKDTVKIIGPRHKITKLFKQDDILNKSYLNVWYCKYLNHARYIKKNEMEEKPTFYSFFLLEGWIAYFFMFCSIPLGVLLFRKKKQKETNEK